jgi:transcriptional regulator with XRE-family HTH domain
MKRVRSYSRVTTEALSLFGKLIKTTRLERGQTAEELAERAGISRTTLRHIESGELGTEIGAVFEVATLLGIRLFDVGQLTLAQHSARLDEKLTLLPKTARPASPEVDDDF